VVNEKLSDLRASSVHPTEGVVVAEASGVQARLLVNHAHQVLDLTRLKQLVHRRHSALHHLTVGLHDRHSSCSSH